MKIEIRSGSATLHCRAAVDQNPREPNNHAENHETTYDKKDHNNNNNNDNQKTNHFKGNNN